MCATCVCKIPQWREATFTTPDDQLTRVYTVCNVAVLNTDNWLYVPYIPRASANRLYIQVRFSIRECANYPDPTSLRQCKVCRRLFRHGQQIICLHANVWHLLYCAHAVDGS